MSEFNIYTIPAAVAIVLATAGMFFQHKNIVYEDRKLQQDSIRLWCEFICMAAYAFILPTIVHQFTTPIKTPEGLISTWLGLAAAFTMCFSSFLRFLKHKKKLKENQEESL